MSSKNKRIRSQRTRVPKDAVQKKRKTDFRASKSKNDALKAKLDSQAHLLYEIPEAPPATLPSAGASVHDLVAVLGKL